MTIIQTDGLRRDFLVGSRLRRRSVTAVEDVTLTVERGEAGGFLGPNGAGKSTTIKMLTGVLVPTAGWARVCGLDPVRERRELARRIGVVFGQRSQLWWDLPLAESFDLHGSIHRVPAPRCCTPPSCSCSTSRRSGSTSRARSGCARSSRR